MVGLLSFSVEKAGRIHAIIPNVDTPAGGEGTIILVFIRVRIIIGKMDVEIDADGPGTRGFQEMLGGLIANEPFQKSHVHPSHAKRIAGTWEKVKSGRR